MYLLGRHVHGPRFTTPEFNQTELQLQTLFGVLIYRLYFFGEMKHK